MRRRLTLVFVLLIAGTLLVAGLGTLLVTRRVARNDAVQQLVTQAQAFARAAGRVQVPRTVPVIAAVLSLEGGQVIEISAGGVIEESPPAGLAAASLLPAQLVAGDSVTGWSGNLAFAAAPVVVSRRVASRIAAGTTLAVVLTRQVGSLGPSWLYFLLVAGTTLVVAALVAVWLTKRITRPIVEASAVTRRIASGELSARVMGSPSDYPELASLRESINTMAERIGASRERERQLLLSVSHDLRTPLTSIRGYAEAIQEEIAPDALAAAGVIVNESQRLERLVSDLLDLARLGADRLSLHLTRLDPAAIVSRTVEGFRPQAATKGIDLSFGAVAPGLAVFADPDRLGQVMANLVENGLSYARTRLVVSVWGSPVDRGGPAPGLGSRILVEDDGPGIARADLERVFDRFYQADRDVAGRKGLGLGLAIVAELVRAMGGSVWAESPISDAGGTRMVVSLPGSEQPAT